MIVEYSIFQPLRQRHFRQLWIANLLSNLGSWGQTFAVTWHIASVSQSVLISSLVQSFIFLPVLLFALPAGIFADVLHKPRVLFISNIASSVTALILGLITIADAASAPLLLCLTFVSGVGYAFTLPAWQASISELVNREQLIVVSSLNNLSFNLAACIGPLLGGFIYLHFGPTPLYLFNALSFCWLLRLYYVWHLRLPKKSSVSVDRFFIKKHFHHEVFFTAWKRASFRLLLSSALVIFCMTTAFAALLPSLIRDLHAASANDYGSRFGALGAGAVLASVLLPKIRKNLSERMLLAWSLCGFGLMLIALSLTKLLMQHLVLIVGGGIAWSAIVTSLNGAALRAFPIAMRARCLALYFVVCAAGQAIGGALWGQLAVRFGVISMMLTAGLAMFICAIWILSKRDFLEPT